MFVRDVASPDRPNVSRWIYSLVCTINQKSWKARGERQRERKRQRGRETLLENSFDSLTVNAAREGSDMRQRGRWAHIKRKSTSSWTWQATSSFWSVANKNYYTWLESAAAEMNLTIETKQKEREEKRRNVEKEEKRPRTCGWVRCCQAKELKNPEEICASTAFINILTLWPIYRERGETEERGGGGVLSDRRARLGW